VLLLQAINNPLPPLHLPPPQPTALVVHLTSNRLLLFLPQLLHILPRVTNNPPWPLQHPLTRPHLRVISNPLPLLLSLPQPTQLLPQAINNPLPPLLLPLPQPIVPVVHLTNNRLLLLPPRPLHTLPHLTNNPPWPLPRPLTQPDPQTINSQVPQHPFWPQLLLILPRVINSQLWLLPRPLIQPHRRAINNPLPLLLSLRPPIMLQPHHTKCPLELP